MQIKTVIEILTGCYGFEDFNECTEFMIIEGFIKLSELTRLERYEYKMKWKILQWIFKNGLEDNYSDLLESLQTQNVYDVFFNISLQEFIKTIYISRKYYKIKRLDKLFQYGR